MPKRQPDAPADPDKLVKQEAGSYRSADDRFEVRQADVGWFLVDTQQANEFGQELIHGPFGTLKAVREALSGARDAKAAAPRPKREAKPSKGKAKGNATNAKPAPPPEPTWIEKLTTAEARSVRKLIAALEGEGLTDAEELVRRDRDGLLPAVAARRIEDRVAAVVDAVDGPERATAQAVARAVLEIVATGTGQRDPLPGWALVEVAPDESLPTNRRIDLRR